MKKRTADCLKEFGYSRSVEDFRTALIETKAEHFGDWSIDELTYIRPVFRSSSLYSSFAF